MKTAAVLALVLAVATGPCAHAQESQAFDPKSFSAPSKFLVNGSALVTKSVFVVLTEEFFSGKTRALKILFYPEAITTEVKNEILRDDGKIIGKKDHAYVVLFLDKNNQIWQVNFTSVLPGQTIGRTIAWKPGELKNFSADYLYDGNHLRFKNKGTYQDDKSEKSPANLAWDINFDVPVFKSASTNKK